MASNGGFSEERSKAEWILRCSDLRDQNSALKAKLASVAADNKNLRRDLAASHKKIDAMFASSEKTWSGFLKMLQHVVNRLTDANDHTGAQQVASFINDVVDHWCPVVDVIDLLDLFEEWMSADTVQEQESIRVKTEERISELRLSLL